MAGYLNPAYAESFTPFPVGEVPIAIGREGGLILKKQNSG
jgi:hypothetical protein